MSVGLPTSPGPPIRRKDGHSHSLSSEAITASALGPPIGAAPVSVHPATLLTKRQADEYHPTDHPVPLAQARQAANGTIASVDGYDSPTPAASPDTVESNAAYGPASIAHPAPHANGIERGVHELPVISGPSDTITVDEIQAHLLEDYGAEARRLELEERVHREMVELERRKDKDRVVPGVDNDDLNAMLRSFDKQVQTVHVAPPPYDGHIPRGLDLQPDPDEEFNLHKLNSALERFYASVVVGMLRALREVNRIRKWEDGGTRSAVALAVYAYAWWCGMILPTLLSFLSILIFFPESRTFFFAPPLEAPASPERVSKDDTTALAHEKLRDEWSPAGTESKATSWAQNVQHLVTSLSSPKGSSKEAERVTEAVQRKTDAHLDEDMKKREDAGAPKDEDGDMSRKDKAIMMYAQPAMRIVGGLADKWERVANAINPSPAWEVRTRRWSVFMYLVVPGLLASVLTPGWIISRVMGLVFGSILFADPLISHIIDELDRAIPDWKERLILEHNLFEDVPTNAQLVLRILRNAEHHNHPIPPAPTAEDMGAEDDDEDDEDGSQDEDDGAEGGEGDEQDSDDDEEAGRREKVMKRMSTRAKKTKDGVRAKARKAWDRLGEVKEHSFAVVTGHRSVDLEGKAERAMGKLHINKEGGAAEKILDKLPSKPDTSPESPSTFYVHHKRHGPGHLIIHPRDPSTNTPARIEFTTIRRVPANQNTPIDPSPGAEPEKGHLVVPIGDIVGVQKVGMNLPGRVAVGWALDAEGAGGTGLNVTVVRRNVAEAVHAPEGVPTVAQGREEVVKLSGIVRRNELFDRLLALGDQRWEMF